MTSISNEKNCKHTMKIQYMNIQFWLGGSSEAIWNASMLFFTMQSQYLSNISMCSKQYYASSAG